MFPAMPVSVYPLPEATHEQVFADRALFQWTLEALLANLGVKLKVPKVGGIEVDLHMLYREVTNLGGLELVINRKQWVLVCEPFNFPTSFTNKSYVIKKLYINSLHHYEQIYFHRRTGPLVPPPSNLEMPYSAVERMQQLQQQQMLLMMMPRPAATLAPAALPAMPAMPALPALPLVPDPAAAAAAAAAFGLLQPPLSVVPMGLSASGAPVVVAAMAPGTCFTGVIDSDLDQGYAVTLHLSGQTLQGVLYKQTPPQLEEMTAELMARAAPQHAGSNGGPATAATSHDDSAASQQEVQEPQAPGPSTKSKRARVSRAAATAPAATAPAAAAPAPAPPRPTRNAFQFFQLGINREQLLQLHPDPSSQATKDQLPQIISDLWHHMTHVQRQPFLDMEAKDKERYERDLKEGAALALPPPPPAPSTSGSNPYQLQYNGEASTSIPAPLGRRAGKTTGKRPAPHPMQQQQPGLQAAPSEQGEEAYQDGGRPPYPQQFGLSEAPAPAHQQHRGAAAGGGRQEKLSSGGGATGQSGSQDDEAGLDPRYPPTMVPEDGGAVEEYAMAVDDLQQQQQQQQADGALSAAAFDHTTCEVQVHTGPSGALVKAESVPDAVCGPARGGSTAASLPALHRRCTGVSDRYYHQRHSCSSAAAAIAKARARGGYQQQPQLPPGVPCDVAPEPDMMDEGAEA